MRSRHWYHGLLGIACLALAGLSLSSGPVRAAGDSLTIGYPTDVPTWDSTAVTQPPGQSIYKMVFDSPLTYSPDLKLSPQQIKAWHWLDSNDQRLEVELRDNIYFQDGSRLTTADMKFSFIDRPRKDKTLVISKMMPDLQDIEIESPTKAVLVYGKPAPTAPIYLGFLSAYILPKAYIERVGDDGFREHPIGAGPYKITDYQRGSRIVLTAFDKYWGGVPKIKNVTIEIIPDATARVAAIESGRVDLATQIPLREVTRLAAKPGLKAVAFPYSEIYMLQIPSYVKVFQDENVRVAMQLAINKAAISKAFYNNVAPVLSVLAPPGTPGYVPGYTVPYDKARAKALLEKSGYGSKNPVKFSLFSSNGTFPSDYDVARAIAAMWKDVGIDADVQEITIAKYLDLNHAGELTGPMLYSWANATGDPENYTGRILDPNLPFSAWKDPKLGPVINGLLHDTNETTRLEGYRKLNREASEHAWSIPLVQSVFAVAYKNNLNFVRYAEGYILPSDYSWKTP